MVQEAHRVVVPQVVTTEKVKQHSQVAMEVTQDPNLIQEQEVVVAEPQ